MAQPFDAACFDAREALWLMVSHPRLSCFFDLNSNACRRLTTRQFRPKSAASASLRCFSFGESNGSAATATMGAFWGAAVGRARMHGCGIRSRVEVSPMASQKLRLLVPQMVKAVSWQLRTQRDNDAVAALLLLALCAPAGLARPAPGRRALRAATVDASQAATWLSALLS